MFNVFSHVFHVSLARQISFNGSCDLSQHKIAGKSSNLYDYNQI